MSTPPFDPDDPRLTAYALGEGSPADREAVELLMTTSPEAKAAVEQTAALARVLEGEFQRENDAYWDTRDTGQAAAGKVVAFPTTRRAGSKPAALLWKIAAAVVALGVIVPFALRQLTPPPNTTVASSPSAEAVPPPPARVAAPPARATPPTGMLAQSDAPADTAPDPATIAKPESSAGPPSQNNGTLLALEKDRARRDDDEYVDAVPKPAAPPSEVDQPMASAAKRETGGMAPGRAAASAPAAASGGGSISPVDRIARSAVKVRTQDGSYIGGMAVTTDGWILAARSLPKAETQVTVVLDNRRELPATVAQSDSDNGLCRLRIEGATLTAVTPSTTTPTNRAALTAFSTDRRTGATRFCVRRRLPPVL